MSSRRKAALWLLSFLPLLSLLLATAPASAADLRSPLPLKPDDMLATGNQWIALPEIRADNGALSTFNVLSMRDRGLLQVKGEASAAALQPYFMADGKPLPFLNPAWELVEYWTPTARLTSDGLEMTLTWCAPPDARGAFLRLTLTNRKSAPVPVVLGLKASFGSLERVTYIPVKLRGNLTVSSAPWVDPAETFSYIENDTHFAWTIMHPGSQARTSLPPLSLSPELDARHVETLAPGQSTEAIFVLGAGVEEFSAAHNAKALAESLDRNGAGAEIHRTATWTHARTRTTGKADLDLLMNRNFLFTALYAWGRTIDTEQFVGVTSRSPRYYVSAAYWDRDAMLWSFPGLLDIDTDMAREALEYAFTVQLRNTGTHSRFIDGVVLEDGFQLDEAAAPIVALASYVARTGDDDFLHAHRNAIHLLRDRLIARRDEATGLYSSLQDPQDEYQKLPFQTYDNVLAWKALGDLATLFDRLQKPAEATEMRDRARQLHTAILARCTTATAPGESGTVFAFATDGQHFRFADAPPGSLLKLPALGFIDQSDPLFARTYRWLHSPSHQYSFTDRPYGLPGSYRLLFTASWSIADHLRLSEGREKAWKILRSSPWDAGIITEGVNADTALPDIAGRAFATAAGYVAHAICETSCLKTTP